MGVLDEARAAATDQVRDAIVGAARDQLAEVGAAGLSVRKVARDLDMPSSGIYRYVRSRDELLTMLIARAYGDLADHVATSVEPAAPPRDRWIAIADAVWTWAEANPHEWALLYGSPVPGYAAPEDTLAPGTRVIEMMVGLLAEARGPALEGRTDHDDDISRQLVDAGAHVGLPDPTPGAVTAAMVGWSQVFGLVSLVTFGQLGDDPPITPRALVLATAARVADDVLGLG